MKVNIDLGESYPSGPVAETKSPSDKKMYPTIRYSGDEPLNLPKEGTMLVRFKEVGKSEHTDEEGTDYDCTIEIREIVEVNGEKGAPTKSGSDAEDALDKLAEKHYGKKKEEKAEGEEGY